VKRRPAAFYQTRAGAQPVRDWLRGWVPKIARPSATISEPSSLAGQLVCRPVVRWGDGLFEVRTNLGGGRIARVLFIVERGNAVLLHGFLKKSQKIPQRELQTTKIRLADLRERMKHD